jgi:hypothetical protein
LGSAARGPPALPGFIAPRLTAVRGCPRRTGRTRRDEPAGPRLGGFRRRRHACGSGGRAQRVLTSA